MNYNDRDDFVRLVLEAIKNEEKEFDFYRIPKEYTIKLISYASMKNDVLFLIDATNKIIAMHQKYPTPELNPEVVVEAALWYSIIITYGKLYMDAFDKRSKLEEKDIFDVLDENADECYRTHKEILADRHSFVAHRGESELDNFLVLLKVPKSGDISGISIETKTVRAYAMGTAYFLEYLKLFQKVHSVVDSKMRKQSDRLSIAIQEKSLDFFRANKV